MNYDDWKLATPESEMNLQHYSIVVSFKIHENDEEYVRRNLGLTFPCNSIDVYDEGREMLRVECEFTDEYEESSLVDSVKDAMYEWVSEIGVGHSDIEVSYD
jgi:hypothetical protein